MRFAEVSAGARPGFPDRKLCQFTARRRAWQFGAMAGRLAQVDALVTAAAQGIGRATALAFAAEGASERGVCCEPDFRGRISVMAQRSRDFDDRGVARDLQAEEERAPRMRAPWRPPNNSGSGVFQTW
jgi:hypothetical protein